MFTQKLLERKLRELNSKESLTDEERGFKAGYKRGLELLNNKKKLNREVNTLMDQENKSKFDWGKIKKLRNTLQLLNK